MAYFKKFNEYYDYKIFINYENQLKDPRWIKKRDEILKRDFYECFNCSNENNLEVHHIRYFKNQYAWEYINNHLITLCRECHKIEHEKYFHLNSRYYYYIEEIPKINKWFPIWFRGEKFYKKDCHPLFLDIYKDLDKNEYDKNQQGIYLYGGLVIQPNGELKQED